MRGGGSFTLTNSANLVGAIDTSSSTIGGLDFVNTGALGITKITSSGTVDVEAGGAITINGPIAASGTVTLEATAGSVTGSGIIAGSGLDVDATTGINLTGANTVSPVALTNTASGAITYNGAVSGGLTVTASNTGTGTVGITNSNGLTVGSGGISAGGPVTVNAAGDITQTGVITSTGAVSVTATGTGKIELTGSNAITGTGTFAGTTTNQPISIRNGGALKLANVNAGSGPVTVNAAGDITQSGIITSTGAVSVSATGTGKIELTGSNAITGAGTFAGTTTNQPISIRNGGALELANVNAGSGPVTVNAAGDITQSGVITSTGAVSVTATGTGKIELTGSNAITGAGTFAGTTTNQPISIRNGGALELANVNAGNGPVTVNAAGDITQSGIITSTGAVSVTATGTGKIELTGSNAITGAGTFAGATTNRPISITNGSALKLANVNAGSGPVTVNAGGDITQSGVITSTGAVSVTATGTGKIELTGSNAITGAGTFAGTTTNRPISITNSGALELANVNAGSGPVTVNAGGALTVGGGGISGGAIDLQSANNTDITIGGTINGGAVTLKVGPNSRTTSTGNVYVNSGISAVSLLIEAARILPLSGSSTANTSGDIDVWIDDTLPIFQTSSFYSTSSNPPARKIYHYRSIPTTGDLELNPDGVQTILGATPVNAATETYPLTLSTSGNIYVTGTVSLLGSGKAVTLTNTTAGGFVEISGSFRSDSALTLNPGSTGGLRLNGGSVELTAYGFTVTGAPVIIGDGSSATTNGTVKAATISIGGSINGTVPNSNSLSLETTGGALAVNGAIGAGTSLETLTVKSTGTMALGTAANKVGKLTVTGAGGAVNFTNAAALDIGGISSVGNNPVNLTTSGAGNGISQSGIITTGTGSLTLSSGGGITLNTQNNQIGTVTVTAAGGSVAVGNTGQNLNIGGIGGVGNNPVDLTTATSGSITQSTGGIVTGSGALTLSSAGGIDLTTQSNQIGTVTVTAAGGTVAVKNTGQALIVGGISGVGDNPVNLTTATSGSITQSTGGIVTGAGALTLSSAGGIDLTTQNNQIGTVTVTAAGGTAAVKNTGQALIVGGISGVGNNPVNLTTSGAGNGISQSGIITTGTGALTIISGGGITLNTQSNQIGTVTVTGAGGTVAVGNTGQNLNIGGISGVGVNPVSLTTTTSGNITQSTSGIVTGSGALTLSSAGGITLNTQSNQIGTVMVTGAGGTVAVGNTGQNLIVGGISGFGTNNVSIKTTTNGTISTTGAITGTGGGVVTLETPNGSSSGDHDITIGAAINSIERLVLKSGTSATSTGIVTINGNITVSGTGTEGEAVAAVYIWAKDMTGTTGPITPGSSGAVCAWLDSTPSYTGTVAGNRIHVHPRNGGHIVYRNGGDPGNGVIPAGDGSYLSNSVPGYEYFYVDSSSLSLPTTLVYDVAADKNAYIIDVGTRDRTLTFNCSGSGFIEIRGAYQSSGALNLSPGAGGVRLADSDVSANPGVVNLTATAFTLPAGSNLQLLGGTGSTAASITATAITLRTVTGANDWVHNLTLSSTGAVSVAGNMGSSPTARLGDIRITTANGAAFNGSVWANSFTQAAGSGTTQFAADQNYYGVNASINGNGFQFTGSALTVNNLTTFAANGPVTITGALTQNSGTIRSSGTFTQASGAVSLNGSIITNNATVSNAKITIGGAVTLAGNTTRTSNNGDIVFNSTIDGGNNLSLNGGTGKVEFHGAVGTSTRLGAIARNGTGQTDVYAGVSTNNAAMTFGGPVNLRGNVHFDSNTGGGNIRIDGSIDGNDGTARNLSFTAGTGDIDVTGAVGGTGTERLGILKIVSARNANFANVW
ncbi:MAG: hypothetical protein LBO65_07070, partial [Spirochaetaceae bacterium]|nr:hypothetical protein [Spirochaetaceae bacterium]